MPLISWQPEYSVGVREMDVQHMKLVEVLNRLHDALLNGQGRLVMFDVLYELIHYSKVHFTAEEALMERYGFPGLEEQKREHEQFVAQVTKFVADFEEGKLSLSVEVLSFLKDWLRFHIETKDKAYSPFLNEKGVH